MVELAYWLYHELRILDFGFWILDEVNFYLIIVEKEGGVKKKIIENKTEKTKEDLT